MHDATSTHWLAVALIFLAAGSVKGLLGMGLPTVAMGLLGFVMPVAGAAGLITVPSLVTNVWQGLVGPGLAPLLRRFGLLQAGIVAGVAAMALLGAAHQDAFGHRVLGACLLVYALLGLLGWRPRAVPARWEQLVSLLTGVATGALTAVTAVFVLPSVPYLQSLGLQRDALTQALGLTFTTATLALAGLLAWQGHLDAGRSLASALVVVPALLGMAAGQLLRRRIPEPVFRRCFFAGLLLIGVGLLFE